MNSESPFRISSMVLTVACVLCGLAAASHFMPRFGLPGSPRDPSVVAVNLQHLNLSEFQPTAASRLPQFSESEASRKTSLPAVRSATETATPKTVARNSTTTAHQDIVHSTSFERSVSQRTSPTDSVPHFYAPVTVHPVTVNIDNSGIIREISRVHERLDSLGNEARSVQKSHPTNHDTAPSAPLCPLDAQPTTRRFEYKVHDNQPGEVSIQKQADQVQTQALAVEAEFVPEPKPVPMRIPVRTPVMRPVTRPADAEILAPAAPLAVTPEPMTFVPLPEATLESTPELMLEPLPEATLESTPDFNIEIAPKQKIPDIQDGEPPAVELQLEEPEILPSFEFSTELSPIPESTEDSDMTLSHEESIELVSGSSTVVVERTAFCAPAHQVHRAAQAEVSTPLVSTHDTAKRTTDPPFMNGQKRFHPQPIEQTTTAPAPVSSVTQVSHQTQEMESHSTPPTCRKCDAVRQTKNPTYRIQAVTPPQALQRISSLFR